nr:hypothetical protein BaRGS_007187 [Batillaria attramentaria]
MCKSAAGQCYTAVEVHGEKTRATHGCLDSVPLENRGLCGRDADRGGDAGGRGQGSQGDRGRERERTEVIRSGTAAEPGLGGVLICCAEDMCNYYGENEITLSRNITGSKGGIGDRSGVIYSRNDERHDDDRDLWFKAAVIAVPIAGGFILVLLVLLAVRMLRTDTQRHRRLIQIRRERSLTKAQLYVTDHFNGSSSDVISGGQKFESQNGLYCSSALRL